MLVDNIPLFLEISTVVAFLMAVGIGANDVSNAIGTSVGAKAITMRQALVIAVIFEFLGALLSGSEVSATISDKLFIIDSRLAVKKELMLIMLSSLCSAGTWLLIASHQGWPVSTTHTLVGALIGLGLIVLGPNAIAWNVLHSIFLAWIASPIIGGVFSYCFYKAIQLGILHQQNESKRFLVYLSMPFFLMILILIFSLEKAFLSISDLKIGVWEGLLIPVVLGVIICLGLLAFVCTRYRQLLHDPLVDPARLDKAFNSFMVLTACCMAYAHGSNDIANAIGPLIAIKQLALGVQVSNVPFSILMVGIGGIVVGLVTYGYKVIETVGNNITELTSSKGFCALLATALTVLISSELGYPISTTHTLVGAILGVGLARGIESLNLDTIRSILLSWTVTFPVGGILAAFYYIVWRFLF